MLAVMKSSSSLTDACIFYTPVGLNGFDGVEIGKDGEYTTQKLGDL